MKDQPPSFAESFIEAFAKFADNPNECQVTKFVSIEGMDGKLKIASLEIEFGPVDEQSVKKPVKRKRKPKEAP